MIKRVDTFCLELTNHCNFNCDFCANGFMTRQKGFMDKRLAKRIIAEVKESKFCDRIAMNLMGEPLLYADVFEIIRFAKSIKQQMLLVTNGSLLDQETASRLLADPPEVVAISYHSGNDHSFECRNAPLSYQEYQKRIFEFIKLKFKLKAKTHIDINTFSTVYKPHSRFRILDSSEEIHQFENEWLEFSGYVKREYSIRHDIPSTIMPGINELLPGFSISFHHTYHLWCNTILPAGTKVMQADRCFCRMPYTQCNVLWNGDMTLCSVDYDGKLAFDNVEGKNVLEMFNSKSAEEIRSRYIKGEGAAQTCFHCQGAVRNLDGTERINNGRIFEPPRLDGLKVKRRLLNRELIGFSAGTGWQVLKQKVKNSLRKLSVSNREY